MTSATVVPFFLLLLATQAPGPTAAPSAGPPLVPSPAEDGSVPFESIPKASREGLDALLVDELDRAERAITEAMVDPIDPAKLAEAVGELGLLAHAHRLDETAMVCYRNAARLAPLDARWPHAAGLLLQKRGDLAGAAAAFELAMSRTAFLAPRLRLAEVYRQLNRLDEAAALAHGVLDVSDAPVAHAILGEIALSKGDAAAAVEGLEAALKAVPEANRLHYPLAQAYRAMGDDEQVRRHLSLQGSVGLEPSDPVTAALAERTTGSRARRLRGRRAFGAGRYEEAVEAFRAAVLDAPTAVEARVDLAAALAASGKPEEALAELETARRIGPETPTLAFNLGSLLLSMGQPADAVAPLERAAAAQPDDGEVRAALARALVGARRGAEALTHARAAADAAPFDEPIQLLEAQLLLDTGEAAQALARLRTARAYLPESAAIRHAMVLILTTSGDPAATDAVRALELALLDYGRRASALAAAEVALAMTALGRCDDAGRWRELAVGGPTATSETAVAATLSVLDAQPGCAARQPE